MMGIIREPDGVDFVVERGLTPEEVAEAAESFRALRRRGGQSEHIREALRVIRAYEKRRAAGRRAGAREESA